MLISGVPLRSGRMGIHTYARALQIVKTFQKYVFNTNPQKHLDANVCINYMQNIYIYQ